MATKKTEKVEVKEVVEEVKEVEKKAKKKEVVKPSFFKGYDIRWLKSEPKHPDFGFVAEYEKKFGEI